MTDTKELLRRIAALRLRLNAESEASPPTEPARSIGYRELTEQVQRGATENRLLDNALRVADASQAAAAAPTQVRFTARAAALLRNGRDLLLALRKIADDADFQSVDESDPLYHLHMDAMAMLDSVLRTVQAMPASVSAQVRLCDGLEIVLRDVERRISLLGVRLGGYKRDRSGIGDLAEMLRHLAMKKPVTLEALERLAEPLIEDARAGRPMRILYASPKDPARFAAAHGITVAQVLLRLIHDDAEWRSQLPLAAVAALVHDVGMTRVPADVLLTEGPLDLEQRRLIEKHTHVADDILTTLWPGGGWPVDAATHHHERNDGTGYPLGARDIELAPFTKLLAVCDCYAALCAPRPYRDAFDTRTAMTEVLLLSERDHLDSGWCERLLRLSFYPVGSIVELNDGSIALVTATHSEGAQFLQPSKPIVQRMLDVHGSPLEWPNTLDLLNESGWSIVRSLSPAERRTHLSTHFSQWV